MSTELRGPRASQIPKFDRSPGDWAWVVIGLFLCLTALRARSLGFPDFHVFHEAAVHALRDPLKIYRESPDVFLYPPPAAALFAPWGGLPRVWAQWTWFGLSAGVCAALALRSWASFAAFLLLGRYFVINLFYGQVNIFVLGLMWAVTWLLERKRPFAAGATLAFPMMVKLFPITLVPSLVTRFREDRASAWRAAVGLGAVLAILLALPFLLWPAEQTWQLYREFPGQLAGKGVPRYSHNQSLLSLLLRLFTEGDFFLFGVGQARWTLAAVPETALRSVALAVGGIVAAFSWRKALGDRSRESELAAACFTVLFISHLVWKPYFILLMPALVQLIRSDRRGLAIGIGLVTTLTSSDVVGIRAAALLDAAGLHLWIAAAFWALWLGLPVRGETPCSED